MRKGHCRRGRFVDVFFVASPAGRTRIGIVTPRHGRTAVARNRVRRRLSELARTQVLPSLEARPPDLDLILRAKPAAYGASYRKLEASLMDSMEVVCGR